jgi:hypothetical protein
VPNYNVVMGQGVMLANLTGNLIMTGHGGVEDTVFTCSAVVTVNTANGRAGLFHFPEGSINTDDASKNALNAIAAYVVPNLAYLVFGTFGLKNADPDNANKRDGIQHLEQLRAFLLGIIPLGCRLRRMPATSGIVTATLVGGQVTMGSLEPDPIVDLRALAAGAHGAYTTVGAAMD